MSERCNAELVAKNKVMAEVLLARARLDEACLPSYESQWLQADKLLLEVSMRIERAREGIIWLEKQRGQS